MESERENIRSEDDDEIMVGCRSLHSIISMLNFLLRNAFHSKKFDYYVEREIFLSSSCAVEWIGNILEASSS